VVWFEPTSRREALGPVPKSTTILARAVYDATWGRVSSAFYDNLLMRTKKAGCASFVRS
jgi:hypothetical protein